VVHFPNGGRRAAHLTGKCRAMVDLAKKFRGAIREKVGARSVFGMAIAVASLVPDWKGRYDFWKDWVTKMAHETWFPAVLRVTIFGLGVGLIVWDVIKRLRKHVYRIRIVGMGSGHVLYHADHGYYSIEPAYPGRTQLAWLVDVLNMPAPPGKVSEGTGRVRANLRYKFRQLDNMASPMAWCGEFFSSVNIEPGETRQILLAVSPASESGMRIWNMIVNRRSNSGEAISINTSHEIPSLSKGIVTLDLISCDTGSIISSAEIGWEWGDRGVTSGPTYLKRLV
jgi:hypothetical protein